MSDSLQSTVQCLLSTLSSRSSHRGSQAAQLASDLYTLCVESVSDTELGKIGDYRAPHLYNFFIFIYLMLLYWWVDTVAHCSSVLFNRESGILYFLRESSSLDEVTISNIILHLFFTCPTNDA